MKRPAIGLLFFALIFPPQLSRAADFNPNFVISDAEATETSSYSAQDIQAFLLAQGSALAGLSFADAGGKQISASEIIYGAAKANAVSPRFLLALLQREQSLLSDPAPSQKQIDWATGFGVCDSCSMDDPALQKYRGFYNQVNGAAENFRYFMDNGKSLPGFRHAGENAVIDGVTVNPMTAATANLYNYTPHLAAQQNFWNIWQKHFVRRYPSGSIVTAAPAVPGYWLIRYGERRKIGSISVLLSRYDASKIIPVGANDLLAYPEGAPIKFPNYSLVRSPKGNVYLLVDDEKRGIVSQEVFRRLGFNRSEVVDAGWEDLAAYKDGANITLASAYPVGALLRNPSNGGVYFVQSGVKHPLVAPELLGLYFSNRRVKKSSVEELKSFAEGDPIKLAEGELVRAENGTAVYVISDGMRLPIASADQFVKQGWKWENVKVVSERLLNLSPLGPTFDSKPNI